MAGCVWKVEIPKILEKGKLEHQLKEIPWEGQTFVGSKYNYIWKNNRWWIIQLFLWV